MGITKICLAMPRVKMSRADRNPWLAKMEDLLSSLDVYDKYLLDLLQLSVMTFFY